MIASVHEREEGIFGGESDKRHVKTGMVVTGSDCIICITILKLSELCPSMSELCAI